MPPETHGAAGAERERGAAETGEPAARKLTGSGSLSVILGTLLTAKKVRGYGFRPPAGGRYGGRAGRAAAS